MGPVLAGTRRALSGAEQSSSACKWLTLLHVPAELSAGGTSEHESGPWYHIGTSHCFTTYSSLSIHHTDHLKHSPYIQTTQVKSGQWETWAVLWSPYIICNALEQNISGCSDEVLTKLFLSPNQLEIYQCKISYGWVRAGFQASQAAREDYASAWFLIPHTVDAVQGGGFKFLLNLNHTSSAFEVTF